MIETKEKDFFRETVRALLWDYPQLRGNALFLHTTEAADKNTMPPLHGWQSLLKDDSLLKDISGDLKRSVEYSDSHFTSCAIPLKHKNVKGTLSIIAINPLSYEVFPQALSDTITNEMKLHADISHEVGHLLIDNERSNDEKSLYCEMSADAFMALRHIQVFGNNTGFLEAASWERAIRLLLIQDDFHATSTVLDKILADSKKEDFRKLSPSQTVERAAQYAEECATSTFAARQVASLSNMFIGQFISCSLFVQNVAKTCLATADKYAFQIGLRAFQPFLSDKGAEVGVKKTEHVRLSEEKRQSYRKKLEKKAGELGLTDIFNLIVNDQPVMTVNAPLVTVKVPQPSGNYHKNPRPAFNGNSLRQST